MQVTRLGLDDSMIMFEKNYYDNVVLCAHHFWSVYWKQYEQEGLAVASIARDDPSTLPGDDPSPLPGMNRNHNAR